MTWSTRLVGLRLLIAAAVGGAAWGACRQRARRLRSPCDAVLAERRRIAREIHDSLAQTLLGASLQVEQALGTLGSGRDPTRPHLERARELIVESLTAARRSVWDLRDPGLAQNDLGPALAAVAGKLAWAFGSRLELRVSGRCRPLPPALTEQLFRIGQEAVTNALRHARAEQILVDVVFARDRVILRVRDDGTGFHPEPRSGHFGLVHMAERAEQMAARLAIRSEPGKGTEVEVEAKV